ncbi:GerAB/ArcD/ProY family transporter [Bacillus sp. FJAT-47783]|uniref:GerAB/ArcD/ProY family transporter n=1 Tax=Bacillus sp. FJAT-47783 TaxID=2922712 RepID=UPI001FAD4DBB|nr:GerAB/ArcD/ProY family transporter [Bacillus sp. FJAT-47783]
MARSKASITSAQLFFIIVSTQIGVGILSLPYDVHQVAKSDSWISIIIAGVAVQLIYVLMYFLCKRFPLFNLYEFSPQIVGKWLGRGINILYIIYFILTCSLIIDLWSVTLKTWVYFETPQWVFLLMGSIIVIYFSSQTIQVIARFQMFVSVFLIVLVVLVIFSFEYVDFRYIFPVGQSGIKNILLGSDKSIIAMVGLEVLLFVFPLVEADRKSIFKTVTFANLFVTSYYLFTVVVSLLTFSPEELNIIPEPVLFMLKAINLTVVERIDLLFLSIWIVSVATTLTTYGYLGAKGLEYFFRKPHQQMIPYITVLIFIVSLIPRNQEMLDQFSKLIGFLGYGFIAGIPLLLFIIAFIFKKRMGETA